MKRLKLFFACMLMTVFGVGNVWADPATAGTTLFSENFSSYSANNVPSGSVTTATGRVVYGNGSVTYTCTASGTKIYNENTGGGTAPEILVAKNGGTFVIAGIPSGGAQVITVSWTQNKQSLDVAPSGTGYSGSVSGKPGAVGTRTFDITVADGADATFTLTFTGSGTSNVRVDDILVTVKTAGEGGGSDPVAVTGVTLNKSELELEVDENETLTATVAPGDATDKGVSWSSDDEDVATVADGVVTAVGEGSTTITVTTNDGSYTATCDVTVTAAAPAVEYIKVTGDIEEGDYVIYYGGKVVKNVVASNRLSYEEVTPVNDKIKNPADAIIWHIAPAETEGYWTIYNADVQKYVVCTGSNNQANLNASATANAVVSVSEVSEGSYEILSKARQDASSNNYYLRNNGTYGFAFYGSGTGGALTLYKNSAAPAVAKPTISGDENFVTSTTVTLSHADADHIYYTTNGDVPTTSLTPYSEPFVLTASATVKAIAVKGTETSDVAEKEFTKVSALTNMADVQAEAGNSEKSINVVISNWVVTGVSGSQVWIADAANEKGILLYKSGHGFEANKKLNGEVVGTKIKLYNLYPELTSLVSTDVTVSNADDITPRGTTIAALTSAHPAEQGTVVKLENVTYTSSALSDGVNSIAADNKLYSSLALVDGTEYDITGVVTYYKDGNNAVVKIAPRSADDVYAHSAVVIPTAANLAALKAAARGTYILTLTNAVVTYVNGNNAFIEDATGGALIYFASHGYSAGDCLNGDYQVVTTDYQGKFEITAMEPQAGAAKTTAEIPLTTITIATLNANFGSYESRRIKIAGANVTDAISGSDRNGAINDGAALAVYAAAGASTITLTADDNVDIIGYPGFHNTDQQLNVWRQEDITVNVKEDPELSYDPASETIEQGDAWSAPTLVNPHSLTIASYASNNEAVATVTGEGVIALAGGIGTAVITAHTNGDATYAAGNATYTITVNEAGSYSMSINLSKASYDAAADAEVVWNSSVVTFTADKNDGTKVTNYLAGNYSSGTLIEEVRFYAKNSLSFVPASGVTITKVEWMSTAKGYATKLAAETWTNATVAVDATNDKLVNITPSAAGEFSVTLTDAARSTGITVYYQADAEKAKLTASIAIDDMNMAVGDDDILLSAIAATSNPNKKAISYAVTSGSEYVSITGEGAEAALHAIAEGTATVTATIPNDLGNYTGATTTFNIEVSAPSKVDPALAYTPNELEIEAADIASWSAPAFSNTYSVSPITYTSSKSSVATVDENGVIALAGGYGTAVITASFAGNDDYLLSEATYTITVIEPADVCDGTDDFLDTEDKGSPTSYTDRSTPNGWSAVNAGYKVIDEKAYWMINGKTTAVGVITSPELSDGIASLKFRYANTNSESNGVSVKIEIKQGGDVVKEYTLTKPNSEVVQNTVYTELIENINVEGTFQIVITNLSPSNNTGNKDRVSIGRFCWSNYSAPEPVYKTVRPNLTAGHYYTLCFNRTMDAVQGATFWSFASKDADVAYLVQEDAPYAAGKPYIIYAEAAGDLTAVLSGEEVTTTVANGALYGTFAPMGQAALDAAGENIYLLMNNQLRRVDGQSGNNLPAYRAYIDLDEIENTGAPANVPAHRVRAIPMQPQTATGIGELNLDETPMKLIINGQLFIIRGEKMYDTTGRLVK